jgi:type III secretion protein T
VNEIQSLADLLHAYEDLMLGIALCSIRLYAAFNVLPPMGDQFLTGTTRSAIVVLIGAFIAIGLPAGAAQSLSAAQWGVLTMKEALLGLLIGWGGSIVFWTVESVGALIDTQAGFNNVQMSNPLSGEQNTPVSHLLLQLVVCLFYILGGMLVFLGAMFDSYKFWPPLAAWPRLGGSGESVFLQQMDEMMRIVVKFGAPAIIVMLLIEIGFGLLARAADKLDPHSLSQPVKGLVTMLLLALMTGVLITQIRHNILPFHLLEHLHQLLPG